MSLLVGLTGGMGSGKTLAASFFQKLGAHIIDADLICRKLVEPGQPGLREIIEKFGEVIIDKSGYLNRKK
ncbi:MAG: dephospho-CoA kinase, partial [Nitrospinota bacterium]|nr:dephospho-CoA kinase [Nitrospinota bacterium]MEE3260165.1 dephospho-CoA kinase [Pseudomonadota bacterium]